MKTLQTGTKVLIEATVEMTDGKDDTTLVRFKTSGCYWMDTSDLTVCETAEPIDLNNFCIDITNPVNAELLPGFLKYMEGIVSSNYKFYGQHDGDRFGGIDNWRKMPLTTLPDLQKQHPGVFNCTECNGTGYGDQYDRCDPPNRYQCSKGCQPTPSFKAGQEVEILDSCVWVKAYYIGPTRAGSHVVEYKTLTMTILPDHIRPIPAQPTVESDNKLKFTDCGAPMNEGERKTFTCCDECWNKTYVHSNMAETKINTEVDELKDMLTNCKFTIQDILEWHQKHSGRVEVSVPTREEIMSVFRRNVRDSITLAESYYNAVEPTVRHFITRKEAK